MTVVLERHIESTPTIAGGKPRIAGHRITVQNIAIWHERMGKSTDENGSDAAIVPLLQCLETAVANRSQAVITRYDTEVFRLAVSENELYSSYYELVQARARLPSGDFWDQVRKAVDSKLFNYYKEHIRFAALSLDRRGLSHYGNCFMALKEGMIAHQATVFVKLWAIQKTSQVG